MIFSTPFRKPSRGVLSDYLAEQSIDDYQPMRFDFPDEDIMFLKSKDYAEPLPEEGPDPESKWIMMFDGAVNVNGRGVGAVLITPEGVHMSFCARITFPCTNNEVEYEACILGNGIPGTVYIFQH